MRTPVLLLAVAVLNARSIEAGVPGRLRRLRIVVETVDVNP